MPSLRPNAIHPHHDLTIIIMVFLTKINIFYRLFAGNFAVLHKNYIGSGFDRSAFLCILHPIAHFREGQGPP
jgi:hypothetical protein